MRVGGDAVESSRPARPMKPAAAAVSPARQARWCGGFRRRESDENCRRQGRRESAAGKTGEDGRGAGAELGAVGTPPAPKRCKPGAAPKV